MPFANSKSQPRALLETSWDHTSCVVSPSAAPRGGLWGVYPVSVSGQGSPKEGLLLRDTSRFGHGGERGAEVRGQHHSKVLPLRMNQNCLVLCAFPAEFVSHNEVLTR